MALAIQYLASFPVETQIPKAALWNVPYFQEACIQSPFILRYKFLEIELEAHGFVWSMHRVGDEPEMGEYYRVLKYLYNKKYAEYFCQ